MDIYTLAASIGYINKIAKKISQEGFKVQVESDRSILESTGEEKTFYFLPKVVSQPQNGFDEYIYTNNSWELLGSTDIDVSSKENSENKVDAITNENKSSTTLYPSNKAMTDYVDAHSGGLVVVLTYDSQSGNYNADKTVEEVETAIANGDNIIWKRFAYDRYFYLELYMTSVSSGDHYIQIFEPVANYKYTAATSDTTSNLIFVKD